MYQRAQMPSIEERRRRGVGLLVKTRLVTAAAAAAAAVINSTNVKQVIEARKVSDVVEGGRKGGSNLVLVSGPPRISCLTFLCLFFPLLLFFFFSPTHTLHLPLPLPSFFSLPPSLPLYFSSVSSHARTRAHKKHEHMQKHTQQIKHILPPPSLPPSLPLLMQS